MTRTVTYARVGCEQAEQCEGEAAACVWGSAQLMGLRYQIEWGQSGISAPGGQAGKRAPGAVLLGHSRAKATVSAF